MPADFAAKVRASCRLSRRCGRSGVWQDYGGSGSGGVGVGVCVLAPHARPGVQNMAFALEMVLAVELVGVAAWLGMRRSDGVRGGLNDKKMKKRSALVADLFYFWSRVLTSRGWGCGIVLGRSASANR